MVSLFHIGLENEPSWWQPREGELFDIFASYKKIGSCTLALVHDQNSPRKGQQFFPDSWFNNRISEQMKSILEVTGLETFQQRGAGNGRLCLQALYELSNQKGCDGRMQVFAAFGSAPFYEHCGFEGGQNGVDGLKYFNPTPQNLAHLFPAGFSKNNFCFIPVSPQKVAQKEPSQSQKTLVNQNLQKIQRS